MATDKKKNKSAKVILKEIFTNKTVLIALSITLLLLIFFRIGGSITIPGVKIDKSNQN
jgi:preprotein translocase subunit SecY